jgi:hypothetical protein
MKRFQGVVFAASIAGVLPVAFVFSVMPAQAKQCITERPPHARSYWSYRLIDGRKCWYEGKAMISKSLLHWPPQALAAQQAPAAQAKADEVPIKILTVKPNNLLDAQASIPNDPDASFEARWRALPGSIDSPAN